MTSRPLPNWAREVVTLLPACAHFLLSGNVRDQYFVGGSDTGGDSQILRYAPRLLAESLQKEGLAVTIGYDISSGIATYPPGDVEAAEQAAKLIGTTPADIARPGALEGLGDLIERVADSSQPLGLIIESASRLVRDVNQLSDEEFMFYRRVDRVARRSQPCQGERPLFSPIIWVLDNERDVPNWFSLGNELLRSIVLPLPHTGERQAYADRLVRRLVRRRGEDSAPEIAPAVRILTEQTAGMTLVAMERMIAIAEDQGLSPDRVEDAARSYRVGVTDNPWRAQYLTDRLRAERLALAPDPGGSPGQSALASRVLGQELAVRKALDILVRSATGLTAAQASATATRPRGVLFFAGPTGVGKTELAKALTKLLFDDERFYIRFDMSEFSAEHASDRLIGAPPGYVGYGSGGELTNAIRQRPFSLVLFDEVEKAHARILDKFLQLLDDGRLTDGRGETVFFSEAVIVFTSNLGIYSESEEPDGSGGVVKRRRPTVDRSKVTYHEMCERVEKAIRDYFTIQLGRPELLNRIGDNIVVFDYINIETGVRILDLMLANVVARIKQEHHVDVTLSEGSVDVVRRACLDTETLELGGRGIGSKLETTVINPVANELFVHPPMPAQKYELKLEEVGDQWTALLLPA